MQKSTATSSRPRLCFVGSMLGRNPGYVTIQGQVLADLFSAAGYSVISTSAQLNPYLRMGDICQTLTRRRREIDMVVLDVYSGRSFLLEDVASRLARQFKQRIVMVLHGGDLPRFFKRFPRWARRVLNRADAIVTPSQYLARAARAFGYQARVIPNVIDLNDYPYRHRRTLAPRLFWLRSFHSIYNPAMALHVAAKLRETLPHTSLVMAGTDKGLEPEARQLAAQLQLDGAVSFPGFLDRQGKARFGQGADIFINTSHIDNMPVCILEACAMGLPVVSTDVGGVPDLLTHEQTGLLVPDGDETAMAEAIKTLITNPNLAGKLSENGRNLAANSAWQNVQPQWEQLFAELS